MATRWAAEDLPGRTQDWALSEPSGVPGTGVQAH
jgi:hypothetical protein